MLASGSFYLVGVEITPEFLNTPRSAIWNP
jgi:hypothetical protein